MLGFVLLWACGGTGDSDVGSTASASAVIQRGTGTPAPEWSDTLEAADFVAAADFDGDGVDERVRIWEDVLYWPGGQQALDAGVQVIRRGRLPEGERVLLGLGMNRDHREAAAQVVSVGPQGPEVLWEEKGPRNQIADIRVHDESIHVTRFVAPKRVEGAYLRNGVMESVHRDGLATQQLPLGDGEMIIGRVYGEAPRSHGDLRHGRNGVFRALPSLRGVRSMALGQLDEDSDLELLVGDGWHYAYGEQALGRILLLDGPDWTSARTLGLLDGEYSARSIEVTSSLVEQPGEQAGVLVSGTKKVHYFKRDALGWSSRVLGPTTETSNTVLIRTPRGLAAWIAGAPNSRLVGVESP
ncbi:MAG: hypothetical protein VXW32_08530 [Myxococcota bacterium]|nr:hypothetical protein [Myxococcota bacterium]